MRHGEALYVVLEGIDSMSCVDAIKTRSAGLGRERGRAVFRERNWQPRARVVWMALAVRQPASTCRSLDLADTRTTLREHPQR